MAPYYPIFLNLTDAPCVVVGGGEVAARKARGLAEAGARVTAVAPEFRPEFDGLEAVERLVQAYEPSVLAGARVVIAATDDARLNESVSRDARAVGALVNVVDAPAPLAGVGVPVLATPPCERVVPGQRNRQRGRAPALADFIVPATVVRGGLVLAVSTGGACPALAARVRRELEEAYPETYAEFLALLGAVRSEVLATVDSAATRRAILARLAGHEFLASFMADGPRATLRRMRRFIADEGRRVEGVGRKEQAAACRASQVIRQPYTPPPPPYSLRLVGVNHRTAPVAVRERLAFDGEAAAAALAAFRRRWPNAEGVLVSTCNRVEFYVAAERDEPDTRTLAEFVADAQGLTADQFADFLYTYGDRAAARHLFSVVSGLDSQVVGEAQVTSQVKEAYRLAAAAGTTGVVLNRLFQRSFRVARRVHRDTDVGRHPVSVGSVAAAVARGILEPAQRKTVLLIGAGETADLALRHLRTLGVSRVLVANRTAERSADLARRHGGESVPFEALVEVLAEADIVISSTSAPHAILTAAQVREARRRRRGNGPLFIIDIAVPRDVEPSVNDIDDVTLYNIDDLERACEANRRTRRRQVETGLMLVEREADAFLAWMQSLSAGPVIRALRRRLDETGREAVQRLISRLDHPTERDAQQIELMIRRFANRLAHRPITVLRRAAARGAALPYLALVRDLFGLQREAETSDDGEPTTTPARR